MLLTEPDKDGHTAIQRMDRVILFPGGFTKQTCVGAISGIFISPRRTDARVWLPTKNRLKDAMALRHVVYSGVWGSQGPVAATSTGARFAIWSSILMI